MGQASPEEDEEEEAVTARGAAPDLIGSAGKLTAINLINVQQQLPGVQASRHEHELLSCSGFQQRRRWNARGPGALWDAVQEYSAALLSKMRDCVYLC